VAAQKYSDQEINAFMRALTWGVSTDERVSRKLDSEFNQLYVFDDKGKLVPAVGEEEELNGRVVGQRLMEKARNMNIYVEFQSILDVSPLIGRIKSCDVHIYEVEIQRDGVEKGANPSAVFTIRLNKSMSHAQVLAIISDSPNIYTVEEI
jgi:hypothetical protein